MVCAQAFLEALKAPSISVTGLAELFELVYRIRLI
jgi:hypothetical protein